MIQGTRIVMCDFANGLGGGEVAGGFGDLKYVS